MARRVIRDLIRLALAGLAVLIACAAPAATLRVAIPLEPLILDPTAGAAIAIDEVTYHSIFEGLTTLAADGGVHPLLATGWTVSVDGLRYDFRLRPGVRFHDGEPFDAHAVVFSLLRAIAPGSTNAQRDALANIAGVEALGPLDVRVTLKTPDADFLRLLSYGDAVIVPPQAHDLATWPVGTGPFRFAGWRRGSSVTLVRNPAYWGAPAYVSAVSFRFIADPNAAFAAMRAHDIDLFLDYPAPETLGQLRADPSLRIISAPSESEVILAFNQRRPALADIRVRRAIAMALDRRAIIAGAMYGYGTPIGSHFPPQSPDYLDLTALSPHDPAAARALLAQAGHAHDLAFTLDLPPSAYARRSGEIVAAELGAIGINVTIRTLDWARWLDQVLKRHDFDLTIVNHAEPFDYDIYRRPDYYFGYRSARFDTLLASLKHTTDPAQRHALLQQVQRVLAEDAANGFLFQMPRLGVEDARLHGAWINTPNQAIDLAQAELAGGAGEGDRALSPATRLPGIVLAACLTAGLGWLIYALGWRFVLRRLTVLLLTLLAASVLIFALLQIVPGDPALAMMGPDASPAAVAALHDQLGLGGFATARYGHWLGGMLRGDFGTSYAYRVPVGPILAERLALSLPLALLATLLSILIGVPAGVLAARQRGSWLDRGIGAVAKVGIAVPSFWLALLLILLFAVRLGCFAAGGFPGWDAGIGAGLKALVLPIVALGLPQAAILARVMRAALLDQLGEEHLRAARARGLSRDAALWRHAFPNALGPVLTVLGLQIPFLVAGAAIIEAIFFLPGLGRLTIQAIGQRDLIMVQGAAMLFVTITVVSSFAIDIAQAARDPRLRDAR
ncbi:ABC-type dipeptide/oligopeptide/nickel transport system permease component/ABC-type transport system substrate-binding protein [Sphingomonas vulcanisoli]|uniref:ABC-type dipeptide/oligopeptide/nickel transport system permease component/ABC-type transport system substrate-binding protein n=1 Tax=Sphingomonas vulcanisoli TaxID=1658060 RepID=A0ABX0TUU0_9SPHN|nr:ABC transporter substrate-binding protein [Sphingomonas vulcanisoli]NIJ07540.1 ABC-type dipeptide/oligopeptide/nickel transport system permease component/ABC-type transport system substrate-binding protein [Sphingomonas vulcanisoli]